MNQHKKRESNREEEEGENTEREREEGKEGVGNKNSQKARRTETKADLARTSNDIATNLKDNLCPGFPIAQNFRERPYVTMSVI